MPKVTRCLQNVHCEYGVGTMWALRGCFVIVGLSKTIVRL
jgi:hypothetical protein